MTTLVPPASFTVPVVWFQSGEGPASIVEGFTITQGRPGIQVVNASPTIVDCRIIDNRGLEWVTCGQLGGRSYRSEGGGIHLVGSRSRIVGCVIRKNRTSANLSVCQGPTIGGLARGGGIYSDSQNVVVERCTITGNKADGNADPLGQGRAEGGGVYRTTVVNSAVIGNAAVTGMTGNGGTCAGGGTFDSIVIHSIVATNIVDYDEFTAGVAGGQAVNSIIRLNRPPSFQVSNNSATYCNVEFGAQGVGNFVGDPKTIDGTFHLAPDSPCRDAGTTTLPGIPATDFEGDPRVVGAAPDVGIDEYYARLDVNGVPRPGGEIAVDVHGDPGQQTFLAFAAARLPAPIAIPGLLGTLELDPVAIAFVPLGSMTPSGSIRFAYRFAPTFPLGPIHLQAAVGNQISRATTLNVR